MKSKPTTDIELALEQCRALEARLARDAKLIADAEAELRTLTASADLKDEATLTRAARLQTITALAPDQRTALHRKFAEAKAALVGICDSFVRAFARPRFADLETRALAKVERELRPNYSDPESLRVAALNTTALVQLEPLRRHPMVIGSAAPDEQIGRAQDLLSAWAKMDAFEQQYLA
jgi:hypothetical protein